MIYAVIIAVLVFGTLIYFGNKQYKGRDVGYVIDKNYVCVPANMTKIENELFKIINLHRKIIGINEIKYTDSFIRKLAEKHCKYMIGIGEVSHDNFGDRSLSVKTIGVKFVGEVVAYGYSTASGMLKGYLNSPSHKRMIEMDGLTHIGVRIMKDNNGRYYNTIMFYKK